MIKIEGKNMQYVVLITIYTYTVEPVQSDT